MVTAALTQGFRNPLEHLEPEEAEEAGGPAVYLRYGPHPGHVHGANGPAVEP